MLRIGYTHQQWGNKSSSWFVSCLVGVPSGKCVGFVTLSMMLIWTFFSNWKSLSNRSINFARLHRPLSNCKNKARVSLLIKQLYSLFEFCNSIGGAVLIDLPVIVFLIMFVLMTHMCKKFLTYFMFTIWRNWFLILLINKVIYMTGVCIDQAVTCWCPAQLPMNLHLIIWLFFATWIWPYQNKKLSKIKA